MLNDEIETKFNFKTKLESTRLTRRTLDLGHETMITPQKTNQEIIINPMLKDEVEKKKIKKKQIRVKFNTQISRLGSYEQDNSIERKLKQVMKSNT